MSHTVAMRIGPGNSSGISVSVAPVALPMPRARWPAERPMTTTKYQRPVVRESSIRFCTRSLPSWRAVSKPKVGISPGSGRSLSMVFGTWQTRMRPPACFGHLAGGEHGVVAADGGQMADAELVERCDDALEILRASWSDWRARC